MELSLSEQRKLNLQAYSKGGRYEPEEGDASLKRNTGFIKKIKNITKDQFDQLYNEAIILKSTKFTPEIVCSIMENRWKKNADVRAAAELTSLLHRRYGDFTSHLISALQKALTIDKTLKDEESILQSVSVHRSFIKYTIDLYILGVITSPDIFLNTIKSFIDFDISNTVSELPYLSLLESICKIYSFILFGISSNDNNSEQMKECFLSPETQKKLIRLYTAYFEHTKISIFKAHENLRNLEAAQHDFYTTKGDLTEEQKEEHTKLVKHCDRLLTLSTSISLVLGFDIPEIKDDEITRLESSNKESSIDQCDPFLTLEEKSFYGDLSLIKIHDQSFNSSIDDSNSSTDTSLIFSKLRKITSKEECDQIALEMSSIPMDKQYQKRLVSEILSLYQTNPSATNYYCRILAIITPHYPDMLIFLIQRSELELKNVRKNVKTILQREERANTIKFIAELVKFSIFPHTTIFLYMKSLLDEFVSQNVEPLVLLLEHCGYFLARRSETRQRIEHILQLMRKKSNQSLFDQNQVFLLEHAYYVCVPPSHIVQKDKGFKATSLGIYLKWLLTIGFEQERTFRKLILMPWGDKDFVEYFDHLIIKIWKLKYSNISSIALILFRLSNISLYHKSIILDLIDELFEMIRVGMEENIFQHNQKRLALTKFVGELYNRGSGELISFETILELLYQIITFGHENGFPQIGENCLIDPSHDSFRIRLVCSLLTNSFMNNIPKIIMLYKQLDRFLLFFQYYILVKTKLSADVEFLIIDTFEQLVPKMKIHTDINQVLELLIKESKSQSIINEDIQDSNEQQSTSISEEKTIEDLEFEQELEKMLSFEPKHVSSKSKQFVVPILSDNNSKLTYRLLSKKKNKIITKELYIPLDQLK